VSRNRIGLIVEQAARYGLSLLVLGALCCARPDERVFKDSAILMGTVVEITVAHRSEAQARAAIASALAEIRRIDDLVSTHKPGSVISLVNRDGTDRMVPVGREIFDLLRVAEAISAASGGAFDVTVWPLSHLWDFDSGGMIPSPAELGKNLPAVGYSRLIFNESDSSVGFSGSGMGLDLGAIAKGWAVDCAIGKLEASGIRDAIVDAGGDLRILGSRPGKGFWRIGVQHPRDPGTLLATFELRDTAIVTSGDYERFFIVSGERYHHILDPATGQPARGCRSVTVLAPSAAEADACATAAFVLGPDKGIAFLQDRPGVRGFIVDAGGVIHWTDAALEGMARR
jgi:FAD:protein FMN transferase